MFQINRFWLTINNCGAVMNFWPAHVLQSVKEIMVFLFKLLILSQCYQPEISFGLWERGNRGETTLADDPEP